MSPLSDWPWRHAQFRPSSWAVERCWYKCLQMHVAIPVLFRHVEIVTWFGDLNSDLRKHLEIFWQHEVMKYPLRNTSTIKWLDCVAVGRLLCAIHDLIGQALGDGLDVSEGTVSCTGANQVDGLIHSAQWRHIYSLTAHHTCWAHSCGVFTRTSVLHSIHEHLDGVLVGEEVDDLEGMLDNAHCHELLAVVAAMHHHGAHQALNDGAQSLAEASHLVSALSVRKEQLSRFADGNVVHQTQVRQHHILIGPGKSQVSIFQNNMVLSSENIFLLYFWSKNGFGPFWKRQLIANEIPFAKQLYLGGRHLEMPLLSGALGSLSL